MGIVRAEDIDWTIYHIISGEKGCSEDTLCKLSGYNRDILQSSLVRLKRYCLIDCKNDTWCACSIGEIILKKEISRFLSDGIEFSGGVIRYRPEGEGKQ